MNRIATASLMLFLLLLPCAAARAATVQMVDGSEHKGEIDSISAKGILTLRGNGEQKQLKCADIVEIFNEGRTPVVPDRGARVTLNNGDYLLGDISAGDDGSITLNSRSLNNHKIMFDHLREVRIVENHSREELFRPAEPRASEDVVMLADDSTPYKGTLLKMSTTGITMETKLFPNGVDLAYGKILWVSLALLEDFDYSQDGLVAIVKCVDGSRISGVLQTLQENALKLHAPYGIDFQIAMSEISSVSFRNGSFTYLSDLDPTEVKQDFQFDDSTLRFDWQRDTSVSGNPLTLRGKIYRKGLGVHANNALTFALEGNYKRLRAEIGIDDEVLALHTTQYAGVVFKVVADGKDVYVSGLLTAQSPVEKIDVDVSGVQVLTLDVSDGNGTIAQDRADWANAFLLK